VIPSCILYHAPDTNPTQNLSSIVNSFRLSLPSRSPDCLANSATILKNSLGTSFNVIHVRTLNLISFIGYSHSRKSYCDHIVTSFLSVFTKKSFCYTDLDEEFECLGKEMFIFYRFLCFKSNVNTHVLVLLGYQKLLKFTNDLVYNRLAYITYDC
jgi:hypothetical protein